jgi:hypothetical protein
VDLQGCGAGAKSLSKLVTTKILMGVIAIASAAVELAKNRTHL